MPPDTALALASRHWIARSRGYRSLFHRVARRQCCATPGYAYRRPPPGYPPPRDVRPRGGRGGSERALEPRADGGAAFGRLDVPGEGDEVAPVAVGLEERCRGIEVAAREGG